MLTSTAFYICTERLFCFFVVYRKFDGWWSEEVKKYYQKLRQQGKDIFYLSAEMEKRGWVLDATHLQQCLFQMQSCSIQVRSGFSAAALLHFL